MRATGVVRRVDELGRIVLPIELRRTLDIKVKDPVEIFVEGDQIILAKHETGCLFCGETKNLLTLKKKTLCRKCIDELVTSSPE